MPNSLRVLGKYMTRPVTLHDELRTAIHGRQRMRETPGWSICVQGCVIRRPADVWRETAPIGQKH